MLTGGAKIKQFLKQILYCPLRIDSQERDYEITFNVNLILFV